MCKPVRAVELQATVVVVSAPSCKVSIKAKALDTIEGMAPTTEHVSEIDVHLEMPLSEDQQKKQGFPKIPRRSSPGYGLGSPTWIGRVGWRPFLRSRLTTSKLKRKFKVW